MAPPRIRKVHVRTPKIPSCSEPCGACTQGEAFVAEVPFGPGDRVEKDATIIVLETNKATVEVPSPVTGRITGLFVSRNDAVTEGTLLLSVEPE